MKFENPIPVTKIANTIGATLKGNDTLDARGVNEIHKVGDGDITFVDIPKYLDRSLNSEASIIILKEDLEPPKGKALLIHPNPFLAYEKIVQSHVNHTYQNFNIHPTAEIHESAFIGPGVVIGKECKIGRRSVVLANTYIGSYTEIGDDVTIKPNCTIGSDAFYYKREHGYHTRWTTCGKVVIEDQVDIGANCTIDKGVSGHTVIGRNTKFDNLIHIGHGAEIGPNCLFAAQVGVGGKTILERNVTVYGQVGIAQNLHIGENTIILGQSGVSKNLEANKTYFGYPAQEANLTYRELAVIRKLRKREDQANQD